jgi:hypothetical protein
MLSWMKPAVILCPTAPGAESSTRRRRLVSRKTHRQEKARESDADGDTASTGRVVEEG